MIIYEDIQNANKTIRLTDIKGKGYAEVPQRIKAFRMLFPTGFIMTELLSNENGVAIFKAIAGYYDENGDPVTLATGTAYEKEGSSFINDFSYIENAETSSVGRCLGMIGLIGGDTVASAEEVKNAMLNHGERKASEKQIEILSKAYKGENLTKLLETNGIERLEDITMSKASEIISKLRRA